MALLFFSSWSSVGIFLLLLLLSFMLANVLAGWLAAKRAVRIREKTAALARVPPAVDGRRIPVTIITGEWIRRIPRACHSPAVCSRHRAAFDR